MQKYRRKDFLVMKEENMALRSWMPAALVAVVMMAARSADVIAQGKGLGSPQVALVNGEPITMADLEGILKARPMQAIKLTDAERKEMRKEALNLLIDELIMHQFLVKNAPAVSTAQINKKFGELRDALKAQGETMAEYCQVNGQSEAQVRNALTGTLQWNAYIESHLNEAALRKYYEENQAVFDQVTVRVSHILIRVRRETSPAERDGVRNWLLGLRQDLVAGKLDFGEAARKYSQCLSAPKGGDLGYISRKGVVEESFAKAAFALKVNEISDVIQTESGLHLIKALDRKVGSPSDFKTMEPKVRELAGEELLASLLVQQRQVAQVKVMLEDDRPAKPDPNKAAPPVGRH
jgi:parvulin-like peptidyl-prolyl isomerase